MRPARCPRVRILRNAHRALGLYGWTRKTSQGTAAKPGATGRATSFAHQRAGKHGDRGRIRHPGRQHLRYRTRMTVASSDMSAVSEVGVDCIARTRIDYLITAYVGGREIARTPAGSSDMRRVFDGTRQAYELDTVCRLADSAVGGATVFPELAQANPAPAPFPAPAPAPATVSPAALPSPRIADLPADTRHTHRAHRRTPHQTGAGGAAARQRGRDVLTPKGLSKKFRQQVMAEAQPV